MFIQEPMDESEFSEVYNNQNYKHNQFKRKDNNKSVMLPQI